MKRYAFIVGIVCLLLYFIYQAYYLLMPRVIVDNLSLEEVHSVTVKLPSSKLEFGSIKKGSMQTIYYAINQSDGTYNYVVEYAGGEKVSGECGYVTSNEIGKSFLLTLRPERVISCNN